VVLTPERFRKLYAALGETTHADEQLDAEGAGASGDFVEGRSAAIAAPEIQKTEAEDRRIVRILIIVSPFRIYLSFQYRSEGNSIDYKVVLASK
jgi:hypothetical protein